MNENQITNMKKVFADKITTNTRTVILMFMSDDGSYGTVAEGHPADVLLMAALEQAKATRMVLKLDKKPTDPHGLQRKV